MDLNYIESGYFDPEHGYYIYTADAEASLSSSSSILCVAGKNQSVDLVAFSDASLTASAELIKSTSSSMSSQFDVVAEVKKLGAPTEAIAYLTVEFTTTVTETKIIEFTASQSAEAAIAIQITKLTENNIALSDVFSVAADVARIRAITADESVFFSLTAVNLRSRAFQSETQAAFSLDATGESGKLANANLSIEFAVSVIAEINKPFDATLTVETSVNAFAREISDINLTAFSDASLDIIFEKIQSGNSSISTAFTQSSSEEYYLGIIQNLSSISSLSSTARYATKGGTANLQAISSVYTSLKFGSRRPFDLVYAGSTYADDISHVKSGTASARLYRLQDVRLVSGNRTNGTTYGRAEFMPKASENFVFEMWIWMPATTSPSGRESVLAGVANPNIGADMLGYSGYNTSWLLGQDASGYFKAYYNDGDSVLSPITTTSTFTLNNWNHIAFRRINGTTLQILLNNVVVKSVTYNGEMFPYSNTDTNRKFFVGYSWNSSLSQDVWFDELSYRVGGTGAVAGYSSQPIVGDPETQQILNHFDVNIDSGSFKYFPDDAGYITQFNSTINANFGLGFNGGLQKVGGSSIISTASVDAVADVIKFIDFSANLSNEFAQTTIESRIRDFSETLDSQTSIEATANRMQEGIANIASEFTIITINDRLRLNASDISSETYSAITASIIAENVISQESSLILTADAYRIKDFSVTLEAFYAQLSAVAKIGDFFVNADSSFALDIQTSNTIVDSSEINIVSEMYPTINLVVDGSTILASRFTTSVVNGRIKSASAVLASQATISATGIKVGTNSSVLTAAFTSSATPSIYQGAFADLINEVTVESVETYYTGIVAVLNSSAEQTTIPSAFKPTSAALDTTSALACTISHIEGADIYVDSFATLTAIAFVGQLGSADIIANFSQSTDAMKLNGSGCDLSSQALLNETLVRIRNANSTLTCSATQTTSGVKTASVTSGLPANATVTCIISHIEGADIHAFGNAALTATGALFKATPVAMTSQATSSIAGQRIRFGSISSASTVTLHAEAVEVQELQANVIATATVFAKAGYQVQGVINIAGAMTFVANVHEIDIDSINAIVYMIPKEIWTWNISRESWTRNIEEETRTYIIQGD